MVPDFQQVSPHSTRSVRYPEAGQRRGKWRLFPRLKTSSPPRLVQR
jgi:hypothetical protein